MPATYSTGTVPLCAGLILESYFSTEEKWSGTQRARERGRERWIKEACVSVPLRVPRPWPNVGKVAWCLSHDPWGEAFFLLDPWLEMRHQRKPRKRDNQHDHTSQQACYAWHWFPAYIHLTAARTLAVDTEDNSQIHTFMWQSHFLQAASSSATLLSHSESHVGNTHIKVCVYFKY